MEATQQRGDIRLYACGGAGINIGSNFEGYRKHSESGMATIDVVYLDTSISNLKPNFPEDKVYLITGPGVDGSGKDRAKNAAAIIKHSPEILLKHKPGYVNVVVASASGGSGAVLQGALSKLMIAEDQQTIVVLIGVADSGTEIENTQKAINTLEGIVAATGKAVCVAYFENNPSTPMSKVDEQVTEFITAVSVLYSRQNEGLDTQDLRHFLGFDKKTPYEPHAARIDSYVGDLDPEEHKDTIAVASAVVNKDRRGISSVIPYTCYGVMPSDISTEISEPAPLHLVIKAFPFNDISAHLRKLLDDMSKAAKARTVSSQVLTGTEELAHGFMDL